MRGKGSLALRNLSMEPEKLSPVELGCNTSLLRHNFGRLVEVRGSASLAKFAVADGKETMLRFPRKTLIGRVFEQLWSTSQTLGMEPIMVA